MARHPRTRRGIRRASTLGHPRRIRASEGTRARDSAELGRLLVEPDVDGRLPFDRSCEPEHSVHSEGLLRLAALPEDSGSARSLTDPALAGWARQRGGAPAQEAVECLLGLLAGIHARGGLLRPV